MAKDVDTPPAVKLGEEPKPITLAEFLERTPPDQRTKVSGLATRRRTSPASPWYYQMDTPEIAIHCTGINCNGIRFFRAKSDSGPVLVSPHFETGYLSYTCSNCRKEIKTFSIMAALDQSDLSSGECYKFGEYPSYGPPTPARLIKLIGPDRDIFIKGRQCENHGLGIGAFVYYRRVVENQKSRIFDEIIRVSEKIGAPADMLGKLHAAREETQFHKAVQTVKDALPASLLVNGRNPLTLLHSALSEGLHGKTDAACLELAHDVRVLLAEFSERLGQALKDEAELNTAVARLAQTKAPPAAGAPEALTGKA
jgi:hypothetical protein